MNTKFFTYIGSLRQVYVLISCSGASNLEDLQNRLTQDVMIRRLKKDVLTQLPPKRRQKIPFAVKDSTFKSVRELVDSNQISRKNWHQSQMIAIYPVLFMPFSPIDQFHPG